MPIVGRNPRRRHHYTFMGSQAGLFDRQATSYSEYRPSYPEELYRHILKFCNYDAEPEVALDIATGSGQAAVELSKYFVKVRQFFSLHI